MFGHTAYAYCLAVLFVLFLLARRHRQFAVRPVAAVDQGQSAARRRRRHPGQPAAWSPIYTIAAGYAGVAGALLTQTTAFASLDVFAFDRSADLLLVLIIGGTGYLYGGLIGAILFKLMQDYLSALTPQYWPFWIGLLLVVIVLVGRERISAWTAPFRALAARLDWRSGRATPPLRDGRALTMAAGARDDRPGEAVRRPRRLQQRLAEGREGRAPRADRPERRRQDHAHQPADRRAAADRRPHPARRARHHRARAAPPRQARHRPHLPDQPAVRRPDAAGDRRPGGLRAARAAARTGGAWSAAGRSWSTRWPRSSRASASPT